MVSQVAIIGAGLAGSEAALFLADHGISVDLYEMRPDVPTAVHKSGLCAELVCSNSLKSMKSESAAGMLKQELAELGSNLYRVAQSCAVPAGGALAVDREQFAERVTQEIEASPNVALIHEEVSDLEELASRYEAIIVAAGPLASDTLAQSLQKLIGIDSLAFFDAAAPIVMADSLNTEILFRQSRYEEDQIGDYLNAPFNKEEYDEFIEALLEADRVIARDFESADLFQACQPIEEIARKGHDAPRFGPLKPVGLIDPRTGKRPWAALQLRAENKECTAYNLVGFQTNLTFPEQQRVFSMIPGLENAQFARFGVMHRNTFLDAPACLNKDLRLSTQNALALPAPLYIAGQLGGTEGYCEAIRSGLHAALSVIAHMQGSLNPEVPREMAFGSLLSYATDPETTHYQPMHVNFGILPPLDTPIRNKKERYRAYAQRGAHALGNYKSTLHNAGLIKDAS